MFRTNYSCVCAFLIVFSTIIFTPLAHGDASYPLDIAEQWRDFRSVVVHEDGLADKRLTWMFTLQGFLLGGVFLLIAEGKITNRIRYPLVMVIALVTYVHVISGIGMSASYNNIGLVERLWEKKQESEKYEDGNLPSPLWSSEVLPLPDKANFPPIKAPYQYSSWYAWFVSTQRIYMILVIINMLLIIIVFRVKDEKEEQSEDLSDVSIATIETSTLVKSYLVKLIPLKKKSADSG